MADIVPVITVQPTAPAGPAPTGPAAAGAGASSAAPAAPVAGAASGADFLGQLKAALKSLAGAVTALPATATPATPALAETATTVEPLPSTADDAEPTPSRMTDKPSDDVAELLATLGLVVAPALATPPDATVPAVPTGSASGVPAAPTLPSPPLTAISPANTAPQAPSGQGQAPSSEPIAAPPTPAPDATLPQPVVPLQTATPLPTASTRPTAAQTSQSQVPDPTTPTGRSDAQQATAVPQQPTPPPHAEPQSPLQTVTPPTVQSQPSTDHGTSFGQAHSGREDRDGRAASNHVVDRVDVASAHASSVLSELSGQMPNGVSASAAPAPQNVSPAEVASQIAHQADLFRLPGNRGVRIQLHPEELGGVQVTVRYAPNSGGLELHINVEHASTGDLVQAGWTQLRDALATQGISPDRLVVSVTGPHNASQLDFSSNGGGSGYRPDQGLATFTQTGDQSSQQRSGNDSTDGRDAARVWSSARDSASSSSSSDEAQGSAATPSRIDYRV